MLKYLAGRIVGMLPAVFLLVFFVVVLIQLIPGNIIDLMLAHTPSGMSESEFRYNRNRYMERRREIAEEWADLLVGGLRAPDLVLEGRRRPQAR